MALKKNISLDGQKYIAILDATFPLGASTHTFDAIIHVIDVSAKKPNSIATVEFKDADGVSFQRQYIFETDVSDSAPNSIRQAYLHLKTLPEFQGAEDI
jgi:hypothetical protein